MNYKTLTYERVSLPSVDEMLPAVVAAPKPPRNTCPVCRSPRLAAIEALAVSGMSLAEQHRQARSIGCDVSYQQYRRHLAEHYRGVSPAFGSVLSNVENPVSTEGISKLLLADALTGVLDGEIRIDSTKDLALIMSVLDKREKFEAEQRALVESNNADIDDAYRQLTAIMEAASEVMSEEQLRTFVMAAWQKGLDKNIVDVIEVPIYSSEGVYEEVDMSSALEKYREEQ